MNRIVIVGASAGGLAPAEALRRSGFTGTVTLIGAEPHVPYDRPPLSVQVLAGDWQPDRLALRPAADLGALDLDLRLGVPATGLDPARARVTLADGTAVGYDRLVVATGVRPRRLPGIEHPRGMHTLRTVEDALTLRAALRPGRRLVIVGAGFIGAEVAGTARRPGAVVTLLEAGLAPLAQAVDAEAGGFLGRLHHDHGVDLRTGAAVAGIVEAGGTATGVRLADGTVIPADDVLVAIGSVPNTEWLAGSGLLANDGLLCDQYCAAAPGIYGVGDVCCCPTRCSASRCASNTAPTRPSRASRWPATFSAGAGSDPSHRRPHRLGQRPRRHHHGVRRLGAAGMPAVLALPAPPATSPSATPGRARA